MRDFTFTDALPFVLLAIDYARDVAPGTGLVADAALVRDWASQTPALRLRKRQQFVAVARCSQPRVTRTFYGFLAAVTLRFEREERARMADARRFGDAECLHGAEPDSVTLRECQLEAAKAA